MPKPKGLYAFLFLIVLGLVFLLLVGRSYLRYANLESGGSSTGAQVTSVWHDNKGLRYVNYSYTVDGRQFDGSSDTDLPYTYEGTIPIKYSASDPSFSDPKPADQKGTFFRLLILVLLWNLGVWVTAFLTFTGRIKPRPKAAG